MKYLLPILLVFTLVTVSCNNKQTNQSQQSTTTTSNVDRENEDKIFCKQTFEAFQNPNETIVAESEKIYLQMLEKYGSNNENDNGWYRNNIIHIDSISNYCIELSENGKDEELLCVLEDELGNFLAHPSADSYNTFDLSTVLTKLYFEQAEHHPDYLDKCIELWELNKVKIEAVQGGWNEYHSLYPEIIKILLNLYKGADNAQKVSQMEALLTDVQNTQNNN